LLPSKNKSVSIIRNRSKAGGWPAKPIMALASQSKKIT
jgi:hypothetical protein